ncbi:MAG: serine protease [Ornithinibacter sp.]|nr:serine protease [Ornithinibacter sp.]
MDWDRQALISLRETLARLYHTPAEARRVAEDAGLDPARIAFDPIPLNTWYLILDDASKRPGKVDAILRVALADYPDNDALQRIAAGAPPPVLAGPEPTDWHGPRGPQLERIIGSESTLVPITYLELGVQRSRAVAKVRLEDGGSGTGFLTSGGLLVTNNHVLPDADAARTATAMFNFQNTVDGVAAPVEEHALLPDDFFRTSVEDDWSAVRVEGEPSATWGELSLSPAAVKAGDRVNIIQHPGGLAKRVSLISNVVVFVGGGRVQYLTDTEPGSSGSPVFDTQWNVVALHHSGGWLSEPGAHDPAKQYYRNEGILIDVVLDGLPSTG